AAGVVDVSHMGRINVAGPGALSFLQRVTVNDVAKLALLDSHYSMVCNERGGIMDDFFLYRPTPQEYLLCVNASNREKIMAWLLKQAAGAPSVTIVDRSVEIAQMALQGPASRSILSELGATEIASVKPRHWLGGILRAVPSSSTVPGDS